MADDARFTVVLAVAAHAERTRLMRLLTGDCRVVALRAEATGTVAAVRTRNPDVLVTDAACAADLAGTDAEETTPRTWVVLIGAGEAAMPLREGVVPVGGAPSDRRVLAAVAVAGRFARRDREPSRSPTHGGEPSRAPTCARLTPPYAPGRVLAAPS